MYDELVKRLRECTAEQNGEKTLWHQAADVIESTSKAYQMMAEAYEAEVTRPKWIPVTERLPDEKINPITHDFESIICSTNFGDVRVYKYGTPIGWNEPHFWHGAGIMDRYVTNWMPLPEPPKGDE